LSIVLAYLILPALIVVWIVIAQSKERRRKIQAASEEAARMQAWANPESFRPIKKSPTKAQ